MSEVWFRNPLTYIRECAELMVPNIVWDRGLLHKNRVDPQRHLEIHYPSAVAYRIMLVGDQGTAELRRGRGVDAPVAVYPTWEYGVQSIDDLERMLKHQTLPRGPRPDECGVAGQEHRVVIIRPPNAGTHMGEAFLTTLRQLQNEYPDAIIHYHGTYSYRVAFGLGFASADVDPVSDSAKGRVRMGSGRAVPWEKAAESTAWVNVNGFSVSDLNVPRNRTMFNMRSAIWASQNFDSQDAFRSRPGHGGTKTKSHMARRMPVLDGDKIACDRCSLAPACKYFRDGGVCIISDSETSALARYFKTRDSNQIIEGLGRLMEKQLARAERGLEEEKAKEELDPEVTKILKHVFDGGVKLAKLVDPNLAGGTKVGVFIGATGGATGVGAGTLTPNALVAAVIAELEEQGIARGDIDTAMVAQYIANKNRPAIEVGGTE
jgi:hypothetical protein